MSNVTDVKLRSINKGNLVASGECLVGGMVKVCFLVVNGKNGPFASLPNKEYKDKTGTTKYQNLVAFPDTNLYNEFQEAVKTELGLMSQKGAGETPQTSSTGDVPF